MPNLPSEIFRVYSIDDETDEETMIGQVEYAPSGHLRLLEATAAEEGFLNEVISTMNAKEYIVQKTPPPGAATPEEEVSEERAAEEGEEANGNGAAFGGGTHSKIVRRDEAGFFGALQDYLSKYYGLMLN